MVWPGIVVWVAVVVSEEVEVVVPVGPVVTPVGADVWLPVWVHAAMHTRNANSTDKRNNFLFLKRLFFLFRNK